MKKIINLLVILLVLCACSNNKEQTEIDYNTEQLEPQEEIKEITREDGMDKYIADNLLLISTTQNATSQSPEFSYSSLYAFRIVQDDDPVLGIIKQKLGESVLDNALLCDIGHYDRNNSKFDFVKGDYNTYAIIKDQPNADKPNVVISFVTVSNYKGEDRVETSDYEKYYIYYTEQDNEKWDAVPKEAGFLDVKKTYAALYKEEDVIGKVYTVTAKEDNIRVRTSPEIKDDNKTNLKVHIGDQFYIFDDVKDDKYTWHNIGANLWVADEGNWFE